MRVAGTADARTPAAWRLAPSPGADPSLVVREALVADLPGLSRPGSALVHSTSWRFEPGSLMLVLSYLAILEAPRGPPPGFSLEPLGRAASPARPGCAGPIGRAAVLAHGLRHFALLRVSDPAIAAALPAEWHSLLAGSPPPRARWAASDSSRSPKTTPCRMSSPTARWTCPTPRPDRPPRPAISPRRSERAPEVAQTCDRRRDGPRQPSVGHVKWPRGDAAVKPGRSQIIGEPGVV